MSSRVPQAEGAVKAAHRAMWAMGDYDRFARATVWELGSLLVDACGIARATACSTWPPAQVTSPSALP